MRVLDFANARRAYLLSTNFSGEYRYFLHSGRKIYFTENPREVGFIKSYCPEIQDKKINLESLEDFNPDKVVVTSVSMNFKEYEKGAMRFINKFKHDLIAVDYAWDAARKYHKKKNKSFRSFSHIAVSVDHSKFWSHSQPELDMYAKAPEFTTKEEVIAKYNLPPDKRYIAVTSHAKYALLGKLASFLKSLGSSFFIIWKLKFKQKEYRKKVKKALRANKVDFMIISGPEEKSHTAFLSPLCELSLVVDAHINLVPISFSQVEMMRAGVPTYMYSDKGLQMPGRIIDAAKVFWAKESVVKYSKKFIPDKQFCKLKVDNLFCTRNFINNL